MIGVIGSSSPGTDTSTPKASGGDPRGFVLANQSQALNTLSPNEPDT